ncbi:MAG: helix-turn-helix domain-containing protein [Gammaproteobacteria bacterium]|nr:helix-turn-helix domain-containing protein [Gammaproteobacteria bacterium]
MDDVLLREFIVSFPRSKRAEVRRKIAEVHGVSEVTVRAWANGNRNHPYRLSAIQATESLTGGKVTRHDLRPDIFGARA